MESPPQRRRRAPVPAGFLGMLALVFLIEAGISRWYPLESYHIRHDWRLTAHRAEREAVRAEILCLGDSQVKLDVQPRVLEARLGRPVTNLAVIGGQPPSSYFLLRRALRAGAKPTAVVVDFFPSLFEAGLAFNVEQWPRLLRLPEALELCWDARDPGLFAHWAVRKVLRSYDRRARIRDNIKVALNGGDWRPDVEGRALGRNTLLNHGAMAREANPTNRDDVGMLPPEWRPLPFDCDPTNRLYVLRFLHLAAAHGVRVFWVITPSTPSWEAETARCDPSRQFDRAVRRIAGGIPGVQVVDARGVGYRHDVFFDQTHLDQHGASAFSADLAGILQRELAVERPRTAWLKMPPYRPHAEAIDLEDMNESRQIVSAVHDRRRR
jgi:hypothetical protein